MFDVAFLNELRLAEVDLVCEEIRSDASVLEFGAGTGVQAKALSDRGLNVVAIDLEQSGYSKCRVFPVLDYDGRCIPLADASVDVVFSSNVLEHVQDLPFTLSQCLRVLRPGGYQVHVMPSVAWRVWTFVSGVPTCAVATAGLVQSAFSPSFRGTRRKVMFQHLKTILGAVLPIGHGTSWEGLSELWTFSARSWSSRFEKNGFVVVKSRPVGLFHTGHMLLGPRLSIDIRRSLGRWLGSAATVYVVRPSVSSRRDS